MQMHSNGSLNSFFYSGSLTNSIILDINLEEFSMHGDDFTTSIVISKSFGIKSCRSNDKFKGAFPVNDCLLQQSKEDIGVEGPLMSLIEDDDLILEEIGICDALTNKDSVSDVPESGLMRSFIIESDGVSDFFCQFCTPLAADSIGHANCGHSSGLGNDDIDLIDSWLFAIVIFFNIGLIVDDM